MLVRKIENGGIKYPCMDCKLKSWKSLWAIRALKFEDSHPLWTKIVDNLLPPGLTFTYLLKSKPSKKTLDTYCPDLPIFYKNIILNWSLTQKDLKIRTKKQIENECLWLNENIKTKDKCLYSEYNLKKGILYVSDLMSNDHSFLCHSDINTKYNVSWTFLDTLRMRLTIPHDWKLTLTGDLPEICKDLVLYNKLKNYKTLRTKDLYALLINQNHDCYSKSNTQINLQTRYVLSDESLEKVYSLPYKSTRSTSMQAIQFKILHKIINCNNWLHKIKIIASPQCRFCKEVETIEHFFYSCRNTKDFWYAMLGWWNNMKLLILKELTERDIMLGYLGENEGLALNCCILLGKNMIYRNKHNNIQPDIYAFHCDLKNYLEIEEFIYTRDDKLDTFLDIWGEISVI